MTTLLDSRPLTADNFRFVKDFIEREAAIVLEPGKEYLVETRLAGLAARSSHASVNSLVEELRLGTGGAELQASVVDALTTNETLFFRDLAPFDAVKTRFLPEWKAANPGRKLSIWSAASSTGQEAYSLCMLVREHFPDLQASVLGTDLSPTVVDRARKAVYSQLEVNRGLPAAYLMRYFVQKAGDWHLDDRIKSMATFREMNLAKPWRGLGPFDIIFLRNVMIYFGQETRREILRQVRSVLAPGGIFVVGSAEASVVTDPAFAPEAIGRATWFRVKG